MAYAERPAPVMIEPQLQLAAKARFTVRLVSGSELIAKADDADREHQDVGNVKIPGRRGATSSSAIRERLTHPVVDGDGHVDRSSARVYLEYLKQVAGP